MTEDEKDNLIWQMQIYWDDYQDLERFVDSSEARKLFPDIYALFDEYKTKERLITNLVELLYLTDY